MHEANGYVRITVAMTEDEQELIDWIKQYKENHGASDSQAIKYALRQQAQADIDNDN